MCVPVCVCVCRRACVHACVRVRACVRACVCACVRMHFTCTGLLINMYAYGSSLDEMINAIKS